MQYIITINQFSIAESGIDIDMVDAGILDFLRNVFANMAGSSDFKILCDGEQFYQVTHTMLIKQNPLIAKHIKTDRGMRKRMQKLEALRLIRRNKNSQSVKKSGYLPAENWALIWRKEGTAVPATRNSGSGSLGTEIPGTRNSGSGEHNTTNSSTNSTKENTRFEKFWNEYKKKVDRAKCEKRFNRLTIADQNSCLASVPLYLAYLKKTGGLGQFQKNPLTYLNGKCWETDWQEMASNAVAPKRPKKQIHQRARLDASNSAWAHLE